MKEKMATTLPGTRTSAVQYEMGCSVTRWVEEDEPLSQCVRQGNRKYSISPIYQKPREKRTVTV